MANPELGTKQICPNCQAKFYDLNKRPAHCPKCDTEFDPEEVVRTRRTRSRTVLPDYEDAEEKPAPPPSEDGFEEEADETPEIDQAIEGEPIETDEDADEAVEAEPIEADETDDAVPGEPVAEPGLGVDFEEDEPLADDADEDVPFLEEEDDDFPEDDIDIPADDDRDT